MHFCSVKQKPVVRLGFVAWCSLGNIARTNPAQQHSRQLKNRVRTCIAISEISFFHQFVVVFVSNTPSFFPFSSQSFSPKVTLDDRGNGGKTLQGTNGSLSSTILLAVEVAPVNDAPILSIPAADQGYGPLTAEEDRLGVLGVSHFDWPHTNILDATIVSNASIVLVDADVAYSTGATTPQQPYSRWTLPSSATDSAATVDDTVTVTVTVAHGGVHLSGARSEVEILVVSRAAATSIESLEFAAEIVLSGPMWAVQDALKGALYKTNLNWNSWVGSGGSQLQAVVSEVREDTVRPFSIGFILIRPRCVSHVSVRLPRYPCFYISIFMWLYTTTIFQALFQTRT